MHPLPIVLFAAIDTQTLPLDDLGAWADRQILRAEVAVPPWLGGLAPSCGFAEAAAALRSERERRMMMVPDEYSDLLVGLIYLRHRRGEISRQRMVTEIGATLDAYECSRMSVETWYVETARGGELSRRAQAMIDEVAARAESSLSKLLDTGEAASDTFWTS